MAQVHPLARGCLGARGRQGRRVEPQGGIEPPTCALPRRRSTPKPLRQRRGPNGGTYLGVSAADQSLSKARVFASNEMKTSVSSFDLRALVAEWQDLVGGHVDKAYQREDEVILRINAPAGGKAEGVYKARRWPFLHEVENKTESPPPFAPTLRRPLANARLRGI